MENNIETSEQQFSVGDAFPRREYVEGWIPLDFSFEFSNGEKLIACESEIQWQEDENSFEDEDCQYPLRRGKRNPIIQIVDQDNNTVFDFNTLLPEGFSFVIPRSFDEHDKARISFREG